MLHEEVKKYRELSGDTNPNTPISRIGGYLDGYEKALEQEPCKNTIDRQAVLDIVDSYSESQSNVEDVTQDMISDIIALPPVNSQPEVIRCKDCKHWTNNIGNSELRDNYCNEEAHGFYYRCSGDDYCSFAEKRTDGCV